MKHVRAAAALLAAAIAPFGSSAAKPVRRRSHQAHASSGTQGRDRLFTQDDMYLGMAPRELEDKSMPLTDAPQDEADDDPCAIPFEDATRAVPGRDGTPLPLFRSDYLESCYESLSIDSDNMIQHIAALNAYFKKYYCFYNIARDPGASVPREYQPELGYEIWQGGTVDIEARLAELVQDVQANGASLATFWDIQEVFNGLRDGHVRLPETPPPFEDYAGGSLILVAESTLNDGLLIKPAVSYVSSGEGSDPELTLEVSFADENGAQEEKKTVKTMNGQSVLSFFLGMANKGAGLFPALQSEGARLNSALGLLGVVYQRSLMSPINIKLARPSKLFPESFEVAYTDGSSEKYYHLVLFQTADIEDLYEDFAIHKTEVEDDINQPGAAYKSFKEMEGEIVSAKNITAEPMRRLEQPLVERQLGTHDLMEEDHQYNWDLEDTVNKVAYKIADEYAVLKVQKFPYSDGYIIDLWANFTRAAKEKGVKNCMVDLSWNSGGYIASGDMLTISLYPKVSYEWFFEQLDQTYNEEMAVWNKHVAPLLDDMTDALNDATNQDLQTFLEEIMPDQEDILVSAAQSLVNFCRDSGLVDQALCDPFVALTNSINDAFFDFPSGPQLRTLLQKLAGMLQLYNPFRTGDAQGYDWSIIRTVNRGGVEQNLTDRYTLTSKEHYNAAVASALQIEHSFDEYLLVSNGVSASAAAIVASSVMQLWANREKSGVTIPVTGITYGGTPDPTAMSFASAPANTFSGITIESNIIAYTVLFLISSLLPDNATEFTSQLADAKESVRSVTPIPPYFAHSSLPSMPIRNYYSKFMGPGALPMQYVDMPTTDHIQQIYRFTKIEQSQDLHDLYKAAAKFFAQNQTSTTTGGVVGGGSDESGGGGVNGDDGEVENGSDETGGGGVAGEASSAAVCGYRLTAVGVSIVAIIFGG